MTSKKLLYQNNCHQKGVALNQARPIYFLILIFFQIPIKHYDPHPHNLPYLERIIPALKVVLDTHKSTKLAIHCGKNPYFQDIDYEYIGFEAGKEQKVVRSFEIGLLPLPQNDPFTDGKSPIKGIQYIASGVVVVATKTISAFNLLGNQNNDAGFVNYAETISDWGKILSELIRNPHGLTEMGKTGRDFFKSSYDSGKIYKLLRSMLQNHYMS